LNLKPKGQGQGQEPEGQGRGPKSQGQGQGQKIWPRGQGQGLTTLESGHSDIADNLIESLNAARRDRWEESTSQLNFTHSSRKSWFLIRRLGAAQRPVQVSRPPVSANAVASHLVRVGKTPKVQKHEMSVRDGWRQFLRSSSDSALPPAFTAEELFTALKAVKLGTAPGYDNMHPEFFTHLGPKGLAWLAVFFTRVFNEKWLPKAWRREKVIALPKPGKDPQLPSSYRPISLLSVSFKLFERVVLQRISARADELLSKDQAGFRRGRSTCDQVAALRHRERFPVQPQDRSCFS